ncbi:hypothetical protein MTO96_009854 [Rhipicephalus appendiculatus]
MSGQETGLIARERATAGDIFPMERCLQEGVRVAAAMKPRGHWNRCRATLFAAKARAVPCRTTSCRLQSTVVDQAINFPPSFSSRVTAGDVIETIPWKIPGGGTSPAEEDLKPSLERPTFSGSGSISSTMLFKHAWLALQILSLAINCSGSSYQLPALLGSSFSSRVTAGDVIETIPWKIPGGGTSPAEEDLKPSLERPTFSGSGSISSTMLLKHAWLALQILSLAINCSGSSYQLPALLGSSFSSWVTADDVIETILWKIPGGGTSPAEEDSKASLERPAFSGSGSISSTMLLKHAWLALQILPLAINCSGSSYQLPALLGSSFSSRVTAGDVIETILWKIPGGGTSPVEEDLKAYLERPTFSGSGSISSTMLFKHAWLALQLPFCFQFESLALLLRAQAHANDRDWVQEDERENNSSLAAVWAAPLQMLPECPGTQSTRKPVP